MVTEKTTLVKDKESRILTTEKEQGQRWVEHFREVQNIPESLISKTRSILLKRPNSQDPKGNKMICDIPRPMAPFPPSQVCPQLVACLTNTTCTIQALYRLHLQPTKLLTLTIMISFAQTTTTTTISIFLHMTLRINNKFILFSATINPSPGLQVRLLDLN